MNSSVRNRSLLLLSALSLSAVAACGEDKRVKEVNAGMTRESLLTVIGKDSRGQDSLPNVYQRERYLIGGKNYEVLFFSGTGRHAYVGTQKDTIPWKELTPIAMIDNRVAGKGWEFLDSLSAANKIPLKKR